MATMRRNVDEQIKSSQRKYKDNHDSNFANEPLLATSIRYVYFNLPSITTFVEKHLETESYTKLRAQRKIDWR